MSKNFLITGAARGIGRGLSRLLLTKGHRVFLFDNNKSELEHLRHHLPKLCPGIDSSNWHIEEGDLTRPSDISQAASQATSFFNGELDCLINNAFSGPVGTTAFAELSLEEWNRIIQTNLTGTMLMTQACLPILRRKREQGDGHENVCSSVINMSSTRARQSEPNSEGYATTKAGLIGMTQALACSLAASDEYHAVSVNAILPGWINVVSECKDGDVNGKSWEEGLSKEDHRWHWTGRVGKVDDILRAVEYLVSSGGFVTGQEIVVDGGVTRRMVYPE
ncbi:hypothetical protein LTR64_004453 [Lithohypha guttulata]|uniref:uncharacterized protein n=1 Tax=Lithohypha guttulata TaxID=1690604 RepID=UPI002DE1724A|nr:hypothetical protein LTR51_006252 [Lithohypha guttulata]